MRVWPLVVLAACAGGRPRELHETSYTLGVEGVWGVDIDSLARDADLPLAFDRPVRAVDAAAHCKLAGDDGDIALIVQADVVAPTIELHPTTTLAPGAQYTLTCSDLAGAPPYALAVHARPELAVAAIEPHGDAVAADEVTLAIKFTTPVTLDAARKAVSATPAIAGLDRGTLSADGTEYKVTADLDAAADYEVRVAPLADIYGQQLAQPASAHFHTGDARPRLSIDHGVVALDGAYPIWTRNVGTLAVATALLPRSRIVQAVIDSGADWSTLRGKAQTFDIAARDKWQLTEVALGSRGVYLVGVAADAAVPHEQRVIANVTDLRVLVAPGAASGIVWVTSRMTGEPVDGAKVALYGADGALATEVYTNGDGLAKAPGGTTWIAVVENGVDIAVASATATHDTAAPAGAVPSAFPVTVTATSPAARPGDRLTFDVAAAVPGATVEWTLRARPHVFAGFEDFVFERAKAAFEHPIASGAGEAGEHADDELVADGTGTIDSQGHLTIATRDGSTRHAGPIDYVLSARVTDAGDRTAAGTAAITAQHAPFYLGVRAAEAVHAAGVPLAVDVVAMAADGTRLDIPAHVALVRGETVIAERDGSGALTAADPGAYTLRATAGDTKISRPVYLTGKGDNVWGHGELAVVAGKPQYAPGEIARLVATTRLAAPVALVTIEHGGALEARVQRLQSAGDAIELVVGEAWPARVRVEVALVSGHQLERSGLDLQIRNRRTHNSG